jgi:hypothetical protein
MKQVLRPLLYIAMALLCMGSLPAHAHKPSDSYLRLSIGERNIEGQWDIALRDLDMAIGLDRDDNGELTWDEIRARHADIAAYALARLALSSEGRDCPLNVTQHLIDHHSDGAYAVLRLAGKCTGDIESVDIDYRLLFDLDPQHKGLMKLESPGRVATAIFSPERAQQQFVLAEPGMLAQFIDYLKHGVWHIWIGFDHILFLLSLLLPAVLVYRLGTWHASDSFKASFIDVLKIVTAFTVAHSVTLTLAALGIVTLPSRWVEAAIAASVVIAALNNVFPVFQGRRWVAAFAFGLIHGFGFASVLADLGLPPSALVLALLGFNLGVEAGQLVIVAIFLPLAYVLRKTRFYQRVVLIAGSALIALLAAVWFVERAFDLQLISS